MDTITPPPTDQQQQPLSIEALLSALQQQSNQHSDHYSEGAQYNNSNNNNGNYFSQQPEQPFLSLPLVHHASATRSTRSDTLISHDNPVSGRSFPTPRSFSGASHHHSPAGHSSFIDQWSSPLVSADDDHRPEFDDDARSKRLSHEDFVAWGDFRGAHHQGDYQHHHHHRQDNNRLIYPDRNSAGGSMNSAGGSMNSAGGSMNRGFDQQRRRGGGGGYNDFRYGSSSSNVEGDRTYRQQQQRNHQRSGGGLNRHNHHQPSGSSSISSASSRTMKMERLVSNDRLAHSMLEAMNLYHGDHNATATNRNSNNGASVLDLISPTTSSTSTSTSSRERSVAAGDSMTTNNISLAPRAAATTTALGSFPAYPAAPLNEGYSPSVEGAPYRSWEDVDVNFMMTQVIPRWEFTSTNNYSSLLSVLEKGTETQKQMICLQLARSALPLALDTNGCRVLQKIIHIGNDEAKREIGSQLNAHVIKLIKDPNGNHVIQKCIELFSYEQQLFIFRAIRDKVSILSVHPFGCRIVQRLLERWPWYILKDALEELIASIAFLIVDRFGNYVVQHLLQYTDDTSRSAVIEEIANDILNLSRHKFASNAIEKALGAASPSDRSRLIAATLSTDATAVTSPKDGDLPPLVLMSSDRYANYVVQKMFVIAQPHELDELRAVLLGHVHQLKKFFNGKFIANIIESADEQQQAQMVATTKADYRSS